MFIQNTSEYRKKLKPIKGISTDCEEHPSPVCPPQPCLMDWVPVPQGCWKEKYERDNKEHSKDLLLGAASLLLSLIAVGFKNYILNSLYNFFYFCKLYVFLT